MVEYSDEDVGNIVLLEHVNVQVPDQAVAMMFYIIGMGFTRDPYLNIGLGNMWANVGEQQFHLPTRPAQVIQGHIGVVVPELGTLKDRLASVEQGLAGTKFRWSVEANHIAVTCPWGNRFRCYPSGPALAIWLWDFLTWSSWSARVGLRVLLAFMIKYWARHRQQSPPHREPSVE